jgi:hypothetical protein
MSEPPRRPPLPHELEREFGRGLRRAYEIQDCWSRGTLPRTPELEGELLALRQREEDYRAQYDISRETLRRLMAGRRGLRVILQDRD